MIVVDASVAVKWLFIEPDHDKARALLAGNDPLLAPALVKVEVAAAISRKARLRHATPDQAQAALDGWFDLLSRGTLALSPTDLDLPAAFRLALTVAHPLQDCIYLAAAVRLGAVLVTADPKFVARAAAAYTAVRAL